MQDRHYGFRDPYNGEPVGEPEWTSWDYALSAALQLIEDYTDPNGILVWEKESDKMVVMAVKKIDRFEAAKDKATNGKNYKRSNGEYFIPKLEPQYWISEDELPTFEEWVRNQSDLPDEEPEEEELSFIQ